MPPRVVFDTNIFLSAIIFGGAPRLCLELVKSKEIELIVSPAILLELARVLNQKFKWDQESISELIRALGSIATLIHPKILVDTIQDDPSDNRILEAALAGQATLIISGDRKQILPLKNFKGIKILSARDFITSLVHP